MSNYYFSLEKKKEVFESLIQKLEI